MAGEKLYYIHNVYIYIGVNILVVLNNKLIEIKIYDRGLATEINIGE